MLLSSLRIFNFKILTFFQQNAVQSIAYMCQMYYQFKKSNVLAAVWSSPTPYRLDEVKMGLGLTGKLGCAWVLSGCFCGTACIHWSVALHPASHRLNCSLKDSEPLYHSLYVLTCITSFHYLSIPGKAFIFFITNMFKLK